MPALWKEQLKSRRQDHAACKIDCGTAVAATSAKSRISYNYPVNQQITYTGSGAQGVAGQPSGDLVNAYQNNTVVPNPNVPGTNTTSGSLEYQSQKAAATTAITANGGSTQGLVLWP